LPLNSFAGRLHPEKWYQKKWCEEQNGIIEYKLPDKTRVDCLTEKYAIEVDFADKWAEAIGQSLYYAYQTNRQPGIIIIMEKESDDRYLKRLLVVAEELSIVVWTIK